MDLKEFLSEYINKVEPFFKEYFSEKRKEASSVDPLAVDVINTLENFISGGKKVRGALTLLGSQMVGIKNENSIIPVSAAIEIMHSSLLIHDDFVDHDDFRRGKPTVHKIYSKENSDHYGASIAIIVGDVGIFLSNQIIANSEFNPKLITLAFNYYEKLLINTGYGEIMDIAFDRRKTLTWEEILNVRIYKTAHYTFVMPLTVGAVLGGASGKILNDIKKYGEPVGVGFQIRDDILGVFGNPEKMGKSNESDIREGKKTFIFAKALELANTSEKKFLLENYGSPKLDKSLVETIRKIFADCGAKEYSQNLAIKLVNDGKKYIPKITKNKECQKILSEFADFVVLREK